MKKYISPTSTPIKFPEPLCADLNPSKGDPGDLTRRKDNRTSTSDSRGWSNKLWEN